MQRRARCVGTTLVELIVALGLLTVAVGCLVQVLVAVSDGQQQAHNTRQALAKAQEIAETVIGHTGDWQALCAQYDAVDGMDVVVKAAGSHATANWWKVIVRVQYPADIGSEAHRATLVFGMAGG